MPQCLECQKPFDCPSEELEFLKRFDVSTLNRCAWCRLRRRLAFWPFVGTFHQRTDSLTGKPLISVFSPQARFPVTDRKNWYSDRFEAPAKKVDLTQSFLQQLKVLQEETPHFHMLGDDKNVNCDYGDDVWSCKDCYFVGSMVKVENSHYMYRIVDSRDSLDCTYCFNLEQCYENTYCFRSYNVKYARDARDCIDSWFVYDCRNVRNCFLCWNLRNKQYCIRNKQYSKEEYNAELETYTLNARSTLERLAREFQDHLQQDAIHRPVYTTHCDHVRGNYLDYCTNVIDTFFTEKGENCRNMFRNHKVKDCLDNTGLLEGELCYETDQCAYLYNVKFSSFAIRCRDSEYLDECVDCSDCFGCVGLKKKRFCILNTPYIEAEYRQLKEKIITKMKVDQEYGEFLPYSMMYTGYNQTLAYQYFPLTREEVVRFGGYWEEIDAVQEHGEEISDVVDAYSNWIGRVVQCQKTKKPFKLIEQEINFYARHRLPIPNIHPNERNLRRFRTLAGIEPYTVQCFHCSTSVTTYYGPEFGYAKIACEECYQNLIY